MEAQHERLAAWFARQFPEADQVLVEGLDRVSFGHSAEMLVLTVVVRTGSDEARHDVVVKLRPPSPGLLEPYDMERQFRILQALEKTEVLAPPVLWFEPTGDVLGREFYVMERVEATAWERELPPGVDEDPDLISRMTDGIVDQLVAVHQVDLAATGLDSLGDGRTYLDRQLEHWAGEVRRVQKGPLPALERLLEELHRQRPASSDRVVLLHGDAKPGNFGFAGTDVTALFDWEMTDVGDPMSDIGYLELMWSYPVGIVSHPSAPSIEDVLRRYEERSGIPIDQAQRPWFRAFQAYKLAAIMLVGAMLFDDGHSDDLRGFEMAMGIDFSTQAGLRDLGVEETLKPGPVMPSNERIEAAMARAAQHS